jgi:hypothetical protein
MSYELIISGEKGDMVPRGKSRLLNGLNEPLKGDSNEGDY